MSPEAAKDKRLNMSVWHNLNNLGGEETPTLDG